MLADFQGQARLKENLSIFIQAALKRGSSRSYVSDRTAGTGKTTLASIIANEMGWNSHDQRPGVGQTELAGILTNVTENSIFIDESTA